MKNKAIYILFLLYFFVKNIIFAQNVPVLIKNINPNGGSECGVGFYPIKNDLIFFFALDKPYITDGTEKGTAPMTLPFGLSSLKLKFGAYEPQKKLIYFTVSNSNGTNPSLWVTDGTTNGTVQIKQINTQYNVSWNKAFSVFNGLTYFRVEKGVNSTDVGLWVTDGTASGTKHLLKEEINEVQVFKNKVYFRVNKYDNNLTLPYEYWETDGTVANTKLFFLPTDIEILFTTKNNIYLEGANFANNTRELKVINPNTKVVTKILTGINQYLRFTIDGPISVGTTDFFTVSKNSSSSLNYKNKLYSTNGTAAGTKVVKEVPEDIEYTDLYATDKFLIFTTEFDFYVSDGTAAGTNLIVMKKGNKYQSYYFGFTTVGNKIYFSTDYADENGINWGGELMVTDGTVKGSKMYFDINLSGSSLPQNISPITLNGQTTLFFFAKPSDFVGYEPMYIGINQTTATNEIKNTDFNLQIHPNPVEDLLLITADVKIEKVEIYNNIGQMVKSEENPEHQLSIASLQKGIYFVKIYHENKSITKKIIKI